MRMILKKLYLSVAAYPLSLVAQLFSWYKRPRMVYGFRDPKTGVFRKHTRISDTVCIVQKKGLSIADHVWIWHHSIIDSSEGICIEEGCQIGAWVGIFTHSSHIAIRLHGRKFINMDSKHRIGYTRDNVVIGKYSFIAAGAKILPGVVIGKGSVIAAGAVVSNNMNVPDFSIVAGNPAKIIGDTRNMDAKFMDKHPELVDSYFDFESYQKFIRKEKGE